MEHGAKRRGQNAKGIEQSVEIRDRCSMIEPRLINSANNLKVYKDAFVIAEEIFENSGADTWLDFVKDCDYLKREHYEQPLKGKYKSVDSVPTSSP